MKAGNEMHSVSVTVSHSDAGAELLRRIANAVGGDVATAAEPKPASVRKEATTETGEVAVTRRRGRPSHADIEAGAKARSAAATKTVEDPTAEGDDLDFGDAGDDDITGGEEVAPKAKPLSLEADIIPAFQAFAAKFDRDRAAKILAKYGVKSVRSLPEDKYPEIMKLLKV